MARPSGIQVGSLKKDIGPAVTAVILRVLTSMT